MKLEDQLVADFTPAIMTDHEFSRWCKNHGWTGDYVKIGNANAFTVDGTAIALVVYRNNPPVDRWIYLYKELVHTPTVQEVFSG